MGVTVISSAAEMAVELSTGGPWWNPVVCAIFLVGCVLQPLSVASSLISTSKIEVYKHWILNIYFLFIEKVNNKSTACLCFMDHLFTFKGYDFSEGRNFFFVESMRSRCFHFCNELSWYHLFLFYTNKMKIDITCLYIYYYYLKYNG